MHRLRLSPDGTKIVASQQDRMTGKGDLFLYSVANGSENRFTFQPGYRSRPIWSPEGDSVAYTSQTGGNYGIYKKDVHGDSEELLLTSHSMQSPLDWSPDRKYLVIQQYRPISRTDLWILPINGDKKPFPFVQGPYGEVDPQFSPDGKWVAYAVDETGNYEFYVFVRPFPGPGSAHRVSTGHSRAPFLRADGKELFYYSNRKTR